MNNELIIDFTPTGMIPMKSMNPSVPIRVNEIVDDVKRSCDLFITKVHWHAREEESGVPTYKKEIYGRIVEGIRVFDPELVICLSLSGRNFSELEFR